MIRGISSLYHTMMSVDQEKPHDNTPTLLKIPSPNTHNPTTNPPKPSIPNKPISLNNKLVNTIEPTMTLDHRTQKDITRERLHNNSSARPMKSLLVGSRPSIVLLLLSIIRFDLMHFEFVY